MRFPFYFCVLGVLLTSCGGDKTGFVIKDPIFLSDLPAAADSTAYLSIDLDDAVLNGIEIPTKNQTSNGYLNFSFKLENTSGDLKRYLYKIYYQNESYKFDEKDPFASENFYGSWEKKEFVFKPTRLLPPGETAEIRDSFKIVGNPRNEKVYFGSDPFKNLITQEKIQSTINYMKTISDWVKQLREKSVRNKVSLDEQFYMDALWSLNDQKQRDSTCNNRWKRNPRVGIYKFILVVTTLEEFQKIPSEIRDISKKNGEGAFSNPFTFFRNIPSGQLAHTKVIEASKKLQVNAKLNLESGIFINLLSANKPGFSKDFYTDKCSDSLDKYQKAQVELFFHNINKDFVMHNIPEVRDVVQEDISRNEYNGFVQKYERSPLLKDTYVNSTDCPCKNATVDAKERSITLKNPGNKPGEFKKEHVGLVTRIGFTYGKFRAKIKFPEMLSKDNVWNGITNAFWMIAQDGNSTWNMRRPCNADIAYIPKQEPDNETALQHSKKQITYSEIDFEIVKESEFWPLTSYKNSNVSYRTDKAADNDDVMVTCTNWDMACHEPKKFSIGAKEFTVDGAKYLLHRWDHFYKALTTKIPVKHDEIFKRPYYYFEIEWLPEKIVWRIGPEKDKMRVICVMDKDISAIPSNQMLMVITQEWHNQEWWPTAPFKQNFIPFPKNDIIGKVLEIEIE